MHNVARKHSSVSQGQKEGESDGSWINDEGGYCLSLHVHVGLHTWQHLTKNGCVCKDMHTHIFHYNWWQSPNQANIFQMHAYQEVGSKMPAEFQFGLKICALMCYSTLSPLTWWILCRSSSNTQGEAPERAMERREGGKRGRSKTREISGRKAM